MVPFVAELMSIPIGSEYEAIALTPTQMKNQNFSIFIELLRDLSKKRPIFCLFEDIHWIDPSTQELLDLLIDSIDKARILLIATNRPEYRLRSHGNASGLTLNRLKRRDAAELARLALGNRVISIEAMQKLFMRATSYLYLLRNSRIAQPYRMALAPRSYIACDPSSSDFRSVPNSLRDALTVRLDQAPKARNVAQMAAVIGREFSHDMLSRITPLGNADLEAALTHLKENEIIRVVENRPTRRYAFKHSLLRDVAYETLLKTSRRGIHLKIAIVMEQETKKNGTSWPELIAYHYSLAGNAELAVQYWLLGGNQARAQSANLEALFQYQKALELLDPFLIPENVARLNLKSSCRLADA